MTFSTTTRRYWLILALFMSAPSLMAQLDQGCTVSVLNRTTRVAPDGGWLLNNVPTSSGAVRARATCLSATGTTQSGQSSLVALTPNVANAFDAEIVLGVIDPIPDRLDITATTTSLSGPGSTAQLTATAIFPDGTTADVTDAVTGTDYRISNSAIATVDGAGLVTAVSPGTVLVSALNDGALGVIQIQVTGAPGGDSDGDGIPDDVEISFGLNPNDPADALLDLDSDGLTNLAEFNLGTILDNPDSDGDGIQDGEETIAGTDGFITNPLLADRRAGARPRTPTTTPPSRP